jgi:hypothetical protein
LSSCTSGGFARRAQLHFVPSFSIHYAQIFIHTIIYGLNSSHSHEIKYPCFGKLSRYEPRRTDRKMMLYYVRTFIQLSVRPVYTSICILLHNSLQSHVTHDMCKAGEVTSKCLLPPTSSIQNIRRFSASHLPLLRQTSNLP